MQFTAKGEISEYNNDLGQIMENYASGSMVQQDLEHPPNYWVHTGVHTIIGQTPFNKVHNSNIVQLRPLPRLLHLQVLSCRY